MCHGVRAVLRPFEIVWTTVFQRHAHTRIHVQVCARVLSQTCPVKIMAKRMHQAVRALGMCQPVLFWTILGFGSFAAGAETRARIPLSHFP